MLASAITSKNQGSIVQIHIERVSDVWTIFYRDKTKCGRGNRHGEVK